MGMEEQYLTHKGMARSIDLLPLPRDVGDRYRAATEPAETPSALANDSASAVDSSASGA